MSVTTVKDFISKQNVKKLAEDIESGNAPYDQQQKLTLDFFEKRISKLEERIDEIIKI